MICGLAQGHKWLLLLCLEARSMWVIAPIVTLPCVKQPVMDVPALRPISFDYCPAIKTLTTQSSGSLECASILQIQLVPASACPAGSDPAIPEPTFGNGEIPTNVDRHGK